MNPDAANPTPNDNEQNAAGTPPTVAAPGAGPTSSPEQPSSGPAAPVSPESPAVPPTAPADTPIVPIGDQPPVPGAMSPAPATGAPSMGKKLVVLAGLAVLVLAVVAALLTLL